MAPDTYGVKAILLLTGDIEGNLRLRAQQAAPLHCARLEAGGSQTRTYAGDDRVKYFRGFDVNLEPYAGRISTRKFGGAFAVAPFTRGAVPQFVDCGFGVGHRHVHADNGRGVVDDHVDHQHGLHRVDSDRFRPTIFSFGAAGRIAGRYF